MLIKNWITFLSLYQQSKQWWQIVPFVWLIYHDFVHELRRNHRSQMKNQHQKNGRTFLLLLLLVRVELFCTFLILIICIYIFREKEKEKQQQQQCISYFDNSRLNVTQKFCFLSICEFHSTPRDIWHMRPIYSMHHWLHLFIEWILMAFILL